MELATSVSGTILRSKALAALASPQGIDRYLEQVNPMWAALGVENIVAGKRKLEDNKPLYPGLRARPAGTGATASSSARPTSPAARCSTRCPATCRAKTGLSAVTEDALAA